MDKYNEALELIVKHFRQKDEKDRKSKGLSKIRSDIESIEYRNKFDVFYTSATNELINSVKSDFGKLPDSPLASIFINDIDRSRHHDFLDDHLFIPHGLAKLLDYQTNLRGELTVVLHKVVPLPSLHKVMPPVRRTGDSTLTTAT